MSERELGASNDIEAIAREARNIVRQVRKAALGTLERDGTPYVSLVGVATAMDATPLMLLSDLARHTQNAKADARASLMADASGEAGDPLEGGRVTVIGRLHRSDSEEHRRRYLNRHESARNYAGFKDFALYALEVESAHFIGGFGRIHTLAADSYLLDGEHADAFAAAEAGVLEHMNADHGDAVSAYATGLLGAPQGRWQMTGCDAEGCDLTGDGRVLRLSFETALAAPGALRETLAGLARAARA